MSAKQPVAALRGPADHITVKILAVFLSADIIQQQMLYVNVVRELSVLYRQMYMCPKFTKKLVGLFKMYFGFNVY